MDDVLSKGKERKKPSNYHLSRPNNREDKERKSDHQNNFFLVKRVTIVRIFFVSTIKLFYQVNRRKKEREGSRKTENYLIKSLSPNT